MVYIQLNGVFLSHLASCKPWMTIWVLKQPWWLGDPPFEKNIYIRKPWLWVDFCPHFLPEIDQKSEGGGELLHIFCVVWHLQGPKPLRSWHCSTTCSVPLGTSYCFPIWAGGSSGVPGLFFGGPSHRLTSLEFEDEAPKIIKHRYKLVFFFTMLGVQNSYIMLYNFHSFPLC